MNGIKVILIRQKTDKWLTEQMSKSKNTISKWYAQINFTSQLFNYKKSQTCQLLMFVYY